MPPGRGPGTGTGSASRSPISGTGGRTGRQACSCPTPSCSGCPATWAWSGSGPGCSRRADGWPSSFPATSTSRRTPSCSIWPGRRAGRRCWAASCSTGRPATPRNTWTCWPGPAARWTPGRPRTCTCCGGWTRSRSGTAARACVPCWPRWIPGRRSDSSRSTPSGWPRRTRQRPTGRSCRSAGCSWSPRRGEPGGALAPRHGRLGRLGRDAGRVVQLGQAVPGQVDQVGRHHLHLRLAGVQPPLPGHGDHAHQHLGVHRGELLVVTAAAEEVAEYVLDLAGDIADQAAERAGPGGGGVADQDPEAVGVFLDVTEQRDRGRFKLLPGVGAAENGRRRGEQAFYLTIHHDRVQALLAAEVLVDDGLGHSCLRRDLLDGGAFEAPLGEQPAADVEQLLPALPAGHALAVVVASGRIGHAPIIAVMPPSGHPALPQSTRQQDCWARGALLPGTPGHRAQRHVALPGEPGGQPPLVRPPDVPGPAQLLGPPDDPGADVDLALERPVPGARRIAMVQVVPGLAEGGNGQPGDVARLVPDLEVLGPERVAHRVDRPGDVVQQANADQAGPSL